MIVAAAVSGVLLISLRGWIDVTTKVADEIQAIVGAIGLLGILLALVNAAKEKFGMAVWSISSRSPASRAPSASDHQLVDHHPERSRGWDRQEGAEDAGEVAPTITATIATAGFTLSAPPL